MASSSSSSLSSTADTSPEQSAMSDDNGVIAPTTTPNNDLSTPLDLDHLDTNIMTGAATLSLPVGFPTIVPPNTVAADSVLGEPPPELQLPRTYSLSKNKTDKSAIEYVPEVNNWSEDVQARFSHSLRGMAQLAVDVHKLDALKTVAEHYCNLVAELLLKGPIPFTPPPGMASHKDFSEDMRDYIIEIEQATAEYCPR